MDRRPAEERSATPVGAAAAAPTGVMQGLLQAQKRERDRIIAEMLKIRGLMPLLMKPRNGQSWTRAERRELLEQLRALSSLSPYLLAVALPGSVLMLPLLAWWLDRRRRKR